jgi:NADH dehydrogenase
MPGEPVMSQDNLDSMQLDNVASGGLPGLEALGIKASSLQAIGPQYLFALPAAQGLLGLRNRHR